MTFHNEDKRISFFQRHFVISPYAQQEYWLGRQFTKLRGPISFIYSSHLNHLMLPFLLPHLIFQHFFPKFIWAFTYILSGLCFLSWNLVDESPNGPKILSGCCPNVLISDFQSKSICHIQDRRTVYLWKLYTVCW